jgi:uncharacterized membrane protein YhaH (DUF805 family)
VGKSRDPRGADITLDHPDGEPYVTFTRAVSLGFKQYSVFRGRATRSEYWWWVVFGILVNLVLLAASRLLLAAQPIDSGAFIVLWVQIIVGLALLLPNVAVAVRRLHDIGFSGAWLLLLVPGLIPVRIMILIGGVCAIALLVLLALPSQRGDNKYGPPSRKGKPKEFAPAPDLI